MFTYDFYLFVKDAFKLAQSSTQGFFLGGQHGFALLPTGVGHHGSWLLVTGRPCRADALIYLQFDSFARSWKCATRLKSKEVTCVGPQHPWVLWAMLISAVHQVVWIQLDEQQHSGVISTNQQGPGLPSDNQAQRTSLSRRNDMTD